jgi:penicillin-binding protein 1C
VSSRWRRSARTHACVAGVRLLAALVLSLAAAALALDDRLLDAGRIWRPAVPAFADVRAAFRPSDLTLLDRHDEVVHELRVDHTRRRLEWTPLDAISVSLVRATIAAEDRRFLRHGGVDTLALAASARDWLTAGARRGGSTITMQVATLLDAESTSSRRRHGAGRRGPREKLRQMLRARAIERAWSKPEILETYLNLVAFRGEIVGVAAAAHLLLDKAPHALSLPESLALAALIRSPNAPPAELERRAGALAATLRLPVPAHDIHAAIDRVVDPARPHRPRIALAPHLAAQLLPSARDAVAVRSTLDAGVQRAAIEALDRGLRALSGRNAHDGAALVVDNRTGEVLAWVGGSGALASARYVDGVRAHRQAGSTLKPFLYALAIDRRRLTAASLLDDSPISLPASGGTYQPQNYDEGYRGLVSARVALASSLNVPAVRALGLVGTDDFADLLRALGFAGIDRRGDHYGPALALGAAEVSLAELVNAYRALASGGGLRPLRLTATGEHGHEPEERLLSRAAAFVVADVLSDRESRAATFGLESPLATRFWAAVKTGTSKDMRDNWCVGFSSRFTVGVWVGNASGAPMHDVSGVSGAAPAWLEIMSFLHRGFVEGDRPIPPPDLVRRRVVYDGAIEPPREEWFVAGTEPTLARVSLAAPRPRVVAPVPGGLYALDPDIPETNQRIAFSAAGLRERMRWQLDGRDLGPAEKGLLWRPTAGRHRLALLASDGSADDEIAFEVRPGAAPSPAPPSSRHRPRSPAR